MIISQEITLDLDKSKQLPSIPIIARVGEGLNTIRVKIRRGGEPIDTTGLTLYFRALNPLDVFTDGVAAVDSQEPGDFIYRFTEHNLAVAGVFRLAYFELKDAGQNNLSSTNFILKVLEAAEISEGSAALYVSVLAELERQFVDFQAEATRQWTAFCDDIEVYVLEQLESSPAVSEAVGNLNRLFEEAEADERARQLADGQRATNEVVRQSNEADRAAQEDERKNVEGTRVLAEGFRQREEMERSTAELVREQAETIREEAEQTRITNETARELAEENRTLSESGRVSSEAVREISESARHTAESSRISAESARSAAETIRSENEAARQLSEATRESSESARNTTESSRTSAENARVSAEMSRSVNEATRQSSEAARESAESARSTAESGRTSAESARIIAEMSRSEYEVTRQLSEAVRESAENARCVAESGRTSAESTRNTAEVTRSENETTRQSAESSRVLSETARAFAEQEREEEESDRSANEEARELAETVRVEAEEVRETAAASFQADELLRHNNEQARIAAELSRVAAESERESRTDFYGAFLSQVDDEKIVTTDRLDAIDIRISGVLLANFFYPVGSYYMSDNPTHPSTLFGVGTWERVKGRVLVGVDESDSAINASAIHGGSANPLTAHSHNLRTIANGSSSGVTSTDFYGITYGKNTWRVTDLATIPETGTSLPSTQTGGIAKTTGNNANHANWQPFRTAYIWVRTA